MDWLSDLLASLNTGEEIRENTPRRFQKALIEMLSGYQQQPSEILEKQFDNMEKYIGIVALRQVKFTSVCEHHLLPFSGTISLGYAATPESLVGLSKLARLVDCLSRRLQLQERLGEEILSALDKYIPTKGSFCVIKSTHGCMAHRGVMQDRAEFVTVHLSGQFLENAEMEKRLWQMIA
jgi:GTP cyclohydrolase I